MQADGLASLKNQKKYGYTLTKNHVSLFFENIMKLHPVKVVLLNKTVRAQPTYDKSCIQEIKRCPCISAISNRQHQHGIC